MEHTHGCMASLPPTKEIICLKVPYGAWEPDTLITDTFGNPIFSVLDVQHQAMGAFEAIFGDENGHKLCYVKRRLITKTWLDGWDFCTYSPNFPGQPKYKERDMYGKSVYPFSFLSIRPMKCRYAYSIHNENLEKMDTHLEAMHGWLGSMTVCCTPMVRFGKWQLDFHRPGAGDPEINIDQSKNLLEVERGNDLLAALCIAYAFDKALCQPMVTIVGYQEKEHVDDDDDSLEDFDPSVVTGRSTREMVSQSYRSLNSGQSSRTLTSKPSSYRTIDTNGGYGDDSYYGSSRTLDTQDRKDGYYDEYNQDYDQQRGYDDGYHNDEQYGDGDVYDDYENDGHNTNSYYDDGGHNESSKESSYRSR
mmetsp:Transcript_15068/g.34931  ORF Transcript_15068/g.34931 Transcript_15068/m.34931 type:complete len:362 (+) Transcript_15068:129-1214(+)|eukprot:CAMPEP_0197176970 /NCGR_PEP_ID=MMETSP1423-20130617/2734_1 /TAXON_ID=476441 /ORGANISM="Pseudo-nitzschia heimii, Strain UNC1101" /LENGTH=361 /DNA_ID=CAMNT_0042626433 /DNA_START=113 /DNA_END=1198 /DNA_ORIENTATION=+